MTISRMPEALDIQHLQVRHHKHVMCHITLFSQTSYFTNLEDGSSVVATMSKNAKICAFSGPVAYTYGTFLFKEVHVFTEWRKRTAYVRSLCEAFRRQVTQMNSVLYSFSQRVKHESNMGKSIKHLVVIIFIS